jgi:carbon-monoxide dehydrogenase medium subunit
MKATAVQYRRPESVDEAFKMADAFSSARFMSGGQSLMPMMNLRLTMNDAVVDISRLPKLRESRESNGQLYVGAGITHAMIEDGKIDDCTAGFMRHVAGGIAYRSVRNRGTIGGSLVQSDPAADWPTALLALDATVVIQSASGERQTPLTDFQVGLMETSLVDGELLQGVLIPVYSSTMRWSYMKFCRKVGEFGHSIAAIVLDTERGFARAVLGAAADKPCILPRVSDALVRGTAQSSGEEKLLAQIEEDLKELTTHDADSYEFHLHRTMVSRAVTEVLRK